MGLPDNSQNTRAPDICWLVYLAVIPKYTKQPVIAGVILCSINYAASYRFSNDDYKETLNVHFIQMQVFTYNRRRVYRLVVPTKAY